MITLARFNSASVAWAMVACVAGLAEPASAQPPPSFHIVRERAVFYQKMRCGPQPQDVLACARGTDVKACRVVRPVDRFGALRIAARVTTDNQPGWSVRVRDAVLETTLEQIPVDPSRSLVWTDDVAGHGAFLELMHPATQAQGDLEIERLDCETAVSY